MAAQTPFPANDVLFIFGDIYRWKALDEVSVSGYYIGKAKESYDIARHLLEKGLCPPEQIERVKGNLMSAAKTLGMPVEFKGEARPIACQAHNGASGIIAATLVAEAEKVITEAVK